MGETTSGGLLSREGRSPTFSATSPRPSTRRRVSSFRRIAAERPRSYLDSSWRSRHILESDTLVRR